MIRNGLRREIRKPSGDIINTGEEALKGKERKHNNGDG